MNCFKRSLMVVIGDIYCNVFLFRSQYYYYNVQSSIQHGHQIIEYSNSTHQAKKLKAAPSAAIACLCSALQRCPYRMPLRSQEGISVSRINAQNILPIKSRASIEDTCTYIEVYTFFSTCEEISSNIDWYYHTNLNVNELIFFKNAQSRPLVTGFRIRTEQSESDGDTGHREIWCQADISVTASAVYKKHGRPRAITKMALCNYPVNATSGWLETDFTSNGEHENCTAALLR
ncbi:hypothetical protein QTP88_014595 [Uroleucon formosanum]